MGLDGSNLLGTLIVFDLIVVSVAFVTIQTLRIRLGSVPDTIRIMNQQIEIARRDIEAMSMQSEAKKAKKIEIDHLIEKRQGELADKRVRLTATQNRLPLTITVLDQLIQSTHQPWMVIVRKGYDEVDPDSGQRYLVCGDDAANARRRIEARFPAAQGYRISEPVLFDGF